MTTAAQTQQTTAELSDPHPSLCIYNTLSKKKEPFRTVERDKVGIYLCGPTVYDKAHIGHMVGPVIFDCMKRYLAYCGYDVTWVVNITDVDDKLINKAAERGMTMAEVAEENIADYHENLAALGVDSIDHFPRATDSMQEIIGLIESLVEKDYAYEADGDVYFDVTRDQAYGKLSNRTVATMQGDGGEGAGKKRNAADFALWKAAKPDEPSWESPWGPGRPGWHIECSAMSRQLLGKTFDIHGGGLDLVFPHHENEIAQSECCHHAPMATYWVHNGLLRRDAAAGKIGGRAERDTATDEEQSSGKMSRSKGAGGLAELIARQGGSRIRFFLLRTHYRSTVLFSEPAIEEAATGLETFYRLFKRFSRITGGEFYALTAPTARGGGLLTDDQIPALKAVAACREKFLAAMDDDFNTGGAIAELFELAKIANKYCDEYDLEGEGKGDVAAAATLELLLTSIKELANILGLFLEPPETAGGGDDQQLLDGVVRLLIDLRADARGQKNFARADAIRDGLTAANVTLEDRAGQTDWSGDQATLETVMPVLIEVRQQARAEKQFDVSDLIRDRLASLGVAIEDRPDGAEWSRN